MRRRDEDYLFDVRSKRGATVAMEDGNEGFLALSLEVSKATAGRESGCNCRKVESRKFAHRKLACSRSSLEKRVIT